MSFVWEPVLFVEAAQTVGAVKNSEEGAVEYLGDIEKRLQQLEEIKPDQIKDYFEGFMPVLINFGLNIVASIVIYLIGVRVIKLLSKTLRKFFDRAQMDEGIKQFLDSFARGIMYLLLIALIATGFGVTTASIVALLGSLGLAVGLALQGSLSNFAGGVLILLLKPFKVSDYIIEDGKGHEGTVTEIQLFFTKLTTVDNKVIIIPNGSLINSSLTNVSCEETRRLDLFVDIPYRSELEKVKEILYSLLEQEERRLKEEEIFVYIDSLRESSIRMGCRLWVKAGDYWSVKCELTEKMLMLFHKNDIRTAFPQIEVSIREDKDFSN